MTSVRHGSLVWNFDLRRSERSDVVLLISKVGATALTPTGGVCGVAIARQDRR
jgi:hypothetical protein